MNIHIPETPEPPKKVEKIIQMFPENELEIVRHDQAKKCKCPYSGRQILVCDATRTIECSVCKGLVDSFDYLLAWANETTRHLEGLKNIKVQTRIAQAELNDLERKIKNARATLKRRGQPQPDVERQRYDMMRWNPEKVAEMGLYKEGDEPA